MLQQYFADRFYREKILKNKLLIQPSFCIGLCIAVLMVPIPWVFAWLAAAAIHETGHYIALSILKIPIYRVSINLTGAYMATGFLTARDEFISALAGPVAGISCLFLSHCVPMLAICCFFQSVYNLLPYPDYDGGRCLHTLLHKFLTGKTARIVYIVILLFTSAVLISLGLYLWLYKNLGYIAFAVCIIPLCKSHIIKIPCKQR